MNYKRDLRIDVNSAVSHAAQLVKEMVALGEIPANEHTILESVKRIGRELVQIRLDLIDEFSEHYPTEAPAAASSQQQADSPGGNGGGGGKGPTEKQMGFFESLVSELGHQHCPQHIAQRFLRRDGSFNYISAKNLSGSEISELISVLVETKKKLRGNYDDVDF